jgi:hypothetical protein
MSKPECMSEEMRNLDTVKLAQLRPDLFNQLINGGRIIERMKQEESLKRRLRKFKSA